MYLACIVHVFSMYLDVCVPSYTFVSVTLAIIGNVSYLGICILLYDTFKIHLEYIQDTFRIHSRYNVS